MIPGWAVTHKLILRKHVRAETLQRELTWKMTILVGISLVYRPVHRESILPFRTYIERTSL